MLTAELIAQISDELLHLDIFLIYLEIKTTALYERQIEPKITQINVQYLYNLLLCIILYKALANDSEIPTTCYPLISKLINGILRTCLNCITSRSYKRWTHNSLCLVVKFFPNISIHFDRFLSEQVIQ